MTTSTEPARLRDRADLQTWVRRGCALIVAAVAAYSSYEHQQEFALRGGADPTSAALWPLSVDGLLLLATVGLVKPGHQSRRMRIAVWSAFLGCIAVSLAANIAAVPRLVWQPVLVAGWPPVALLLAVELLAHRSRSRHTDTAPGTPETARAAAAVERDGETAAETGTETGQVRTLAEVSPTTGQPGEPTAQEIMWQYYVREQACGRTPTGAELDRAASTNNYGRTVLRQWREQGRIPSVNGDQRVGVCRDRPTPCHPTWPGRHHPPAPSIGPARAVRRLPGGLTGHTNAVHAVDSDPGQAPSQRWRPMSSPGNTVTTWQARGAAARPIIQNGHLWHDKCHPPTRLANS